VLYHFSHIFSYFGDGSLWNYLPGWPGVAEKVKCLLCKPEALSSKCPPQKKYISLLNFQSTLIIWTRLEGKNYSFSFF
jgi:hypothetical protein